MKRNIFFIIALIFIVGLLFFSPKKQAIDPDDPDMALYESFTFPLTCESGFLTKQENIDDIIVQRTAPNIFCEDDKQIIINRYDYSISYPWEAINTLGNPSDLGITFPTDELQFDFITLAGVSSTCGSIITDSHGEGFYIMKEDSKEWDIKPFINTGASYMIEVGYFTELPTKLNYDAFEDPANYECAPNSCGGTETGTDTFDCPIYSGTCDAGVWFFTGADGCVDADCGCLQTPSGGSFIGCEGYSECVSGEISSGVCGDWVRKIDPCACGGDSFLFSDTATILGYDNYLSIPTFTSLGKYLIAEDSTVKVERSRLNPDDFLLKVNDQTKGSFTAEVDNFFFALRFDTGTSLDNIPGCGNPTEIIHPKIDKVLFKVPFEGCIIEPGEVVVRKDFGAGAVINLDALDILGAPFKGFCINNPPQILEIDVGSEPEPHGEIFNILVSGGDISVPTGFVYSISYITNFVDGMAPDCPIGSAVIDVDTGLCEQFTSVVSLPPVVFDPKVEVLNIGPSEFSLTFSNNGGLTGSKTIGDETMTVTPRYTCPDMDVNSRFDNTCYDYRFHNPLISEDFREFGITYPYNDFIDYFCVKGAGYIDDDGTWDTEDSWSATCKFTIQNNFIDFLSVSSDIETKGYLDLNETATLNIEFDNHIMAFADAGWEIDESVRLGVQRDLPPTLYSNALLRGIQTVSLPLKTDEISKIEVSYRPYIIIEGKRIPTNIRLGLDYIIGEDLFIESGGNGSVEYIIRTVEINNTITETVFITVPGDPVTQQDNTLLWILIIVAAIVMINNPPKKSRKRRK